jgi:hypothetical protein
VIWHFVLRALVRIGAAAVIATIVLVLVLIVLIVLVFFICVQGFLRRLAVLGAKLLSAIVSCVSLV